MEKPNEVKGKRKLRRDVESLSVEKLKRERKSLSNLSGVMEVEEDNYFVTVEETKSAGDNEQGTSFIKHVQINMLSHCIFCLRRTTNLPDDEQRQNVPRGESLCSLSTFNRAWSCIQEKVQNQESQVDPFCILKSNEKGPLAFLQLPVMCGVCDEMLTTIDKLLKELNTQLGVLGKIVQESKYGGKYSWRAEQFQEAINGSELEKEVIDATTNILAYDFRCGRTVKVEKEFVLYSESDLLIPPRSSPPAPSSQFLQDETSALIDEIVQVFSGQVVNEPGSNLDLAPSSAKYTENVDESDIEDSDDEDNYDEWNDGSSDPDYNIKSEPNDDSSDDDSEWSMPQTRNTPKNNLRAASATTNNVTRSMGDKSGGRAQVKANSSKEFPTKGKILKCRMDDCKETFTRWRDLRDHKIEKHFLITPSAHECNECGKSYEAREELLRHRRKVHLGPGPFQKCDLCKLTIPVRDIYEHVRAHVGVEYLTKCPNPQCPHVYSNSRFLYQRHLNVNNNRSKNCQQFITSREDFLKTINVCEECGYQALNGQDLRAHLLQVHENPTENFSCPIRGCLQSFTVRQSVICHFSQHDMRRAFDTQACCECSAPLALDKMAKHLEEAHGTQEVINCNSCPFQFSSRELLVNHMHKHRHGDLACDICANVKFSKYVQLREHYLEAHSIGKEFHCRHCGIVGWTEKWWRQHNRQHDASGNEKQVIHVSSSRPRKKAGHNCEDCGAVFKRNDTLQDHKIKMHGADPFRCRVCSEPCASTWCLRQHEKTHKGEPRKELRCQVEGCGKIYTRKYDLDLHVSAVHLLEKAYVCDVCGKSYGRASGLLNHKNNVHLQLKPHVCDVCGDRFPVGIALRRHQRIHTGERPYECFECKQRFAHQSSLKKHVEGHQRKGADFKPTGPLKQPRKRTEKRKSSEAHLDC